MMRSTDTRLRATSGQARSEMDDLVLVRRPGIALVIGLLLRLERGWHGRNVPKGGRIARQCP
jgi:hypothetical protein